MHQSAISDQPVYFTHTSLDGSGEDTAREAYRFVLLQITEQISFGLLCNSSLDTNDLYSFLTAQLTAEVSKELMTGQETGIDFEVPAFCKHWVFTDFKAGVTRKWGSEEEKLYRLANSLAQDKEAKT